MKINSAALIIDYSRKYLLATSTEVLGNVVCPRMSCQVEGRLFKSFTTTKSTGTVLGLVLSRYLEENFDGSLKITSESGQWVTATVSLPMYRRTC